MDGNLFLDSPPYRCHGHRALSSAGGRGLQDQASKLIHMSGTDFYYQPQIDLRKRLAELAPGNKPKRVFFTNSGAEALERG